MGRGCWLMHLLLMCSLDTKLIYSVNAQSVTIHRVTPAVGDPVEGNVVELRCQAISLVPGNIIEWTRFDIVEPPEVLIARNGMSLDSRYTLDTTASGAQLIVETLAFNATKEDTRVSFGCLVKDSVQMNSTIIVPGKQTSPFTVLYFPSDMYPICFPDGPFTVQEGTTVNMSCTTEIGNPSVQIQVITSDVVYVWTYDTDRKAQMRSLQLDVTAANDGGSHECKITPDSDTSPFTGMERSCTIGPITVGPITTPQRPMSSVEPITTDSHSIPTDETSLKPTTGQPSFDGSCCQLCPAIPTTTKESNIVSTSLLVAFIIILILFIISLIINIFLLIKHRHLKITMEKDTNVPKADPYMELQPTEDKNRVYMEPTTATTTTQDTYYQPVEVENNSPEYDYARPEGSTNTSYEAVRKPQSSAERHYQNIKS